MSREDSAARFPQFVLGMYILVKDRSATDQNLSLPAVDGNGLKVVILLQTPVQGLVPFTLPTFSRDNTKPFIR